MFYSEKMQKSKHFVLQKVEKMEIQAYTANDISRIDNVSRYTVYKSKKYIKVRFETYRAKKNKKWYAVRYIRKSDLLDNK